MINFEVKTRDWEIILTIYKPGLIPGIWISFLLLFPGTIELRILTPERLITLIVDASAVDGKSIKNVPLFGFGKIFIFRSAN